MSEAAAVAVQPVQLPTVSYGPFRLTEAVPWLMFATAMRIVEVMGGTVGLCASVCSHLSIFLAFLLAARRMIELADGTTGLGRLSFLEQLILARKILVPVVLLMLASCLFLIGTGALWTAFHLLLGIDGVAFDQNSYVGMLWSAFLAAIMLLMVLKAESTGHANLFAIVKELWQRAPCMAPGIAAVAAADIGLSVVQGMVRVVVYAFWHTPGPPQLARTMVFFFFVFGFASLRLWVTLAILTFSLRESYRRGHGLPAPVAERA